MEVAAAASRWEGVEGRVEEEAEVSHLVVAASVAAEGAESRLGAEDMVNLGCRK